MSRRATVAFVVPLLLSTAHAAPRKILVLPLDGTADDATRTRLGAEVARLAHGLDGRVDTGSTTFADAAAAVGCDPAAVACAQQVREMLAVDELVWGTAAQDGAQTRLVVHRASRGAAPRESTATLAPQDSPARALSPLFHAPGTVPPPSAAVAPAPSPIVHRRETVIATHPYRTLGIAALVGGGASIAIGVALWASESDLQHQIDAHATATRPDFDALRSLESRASRDALWGNVLVVAGGALAVGGGYLLFRNHREIVVAPHPIAHGAAVTLTIGRAR